MSISRAAGWPGADSEDALGRAPGLVWQWQRKRMRRKFDVYYNRRHGNGDSNGDPDDEKWRRWKN